ncbi:unnamed protein product [Wickerhamomyces anomalus]
MNNHQMDQQPSLSNSLRKVNIHDALGFSINSRLKQAMSGEGFIKNIGDHLQLKIDQSPLQLDYDSMDKSVIAMLLHLPNLKTNNKEKKQNFHQNLEILVKRKSDVGDPTFKRKFDYLYIEQNYIKTSPRYELRFKNLYEVENLSNIEMIHDDIVKLLTNNEVVVPFKKFDSSIHEKNFTISAQSRSKKNDYKFIAELTKIQVLNEFSNEF